MIKNGSMINKNIGDSVVNKGGLFIPQYYYNYFTGY